MASIKSTYLGLYNLVLAGGWFSILFASIGHLFRRGSEGFSTSIMHSLYIWQTAALVEILNSLLGVVRSPISATLPQIGSRLFITWGILFSFPESQNSLFVVSLILSWSLVEIVRYSFFALKEIFGSTPRVLLWLRYSLFFVLYPTGIASEIGVTIAALPFIRASDLYNIKMPNSYNFAFDYHIACYAVLSSYLIGGPYLYTYMISQRKKALAKRKEKTV